VQFPLTNEPKSWLDNHLFQSIQPAEQTPMYFQHFRPAWQREGTTGFTANPALLWTFPTRPDMVTALSDRLCRRLSPNERTARVRVSERRRLVPPLNRTGVVFFFPARAYTREMRRSDRLGLMVND
jgi:hypothetical protein